MGCTNGKRTATVSSGSDAILPVTVGTLEGEKAMVRPLTSSEIRAIVAKL